LRVVLLKKNNRSGTLEFLPFRFFPKGEEPYSSPSAFSPKGRNPTLPHPRRGWGTKGEDGEPKRRKGKDKNNF